MLEALKNLLKKVVPKKLFIVAQPIWHGFWAFSAHYFFGRPSDKMVIIGVTGTKGKTSTCHITYQLLNNSGLKCGLISTAVVDSGKGEELNKFRMTQVSGTISHKLLKQMLETGYKYAVVEVSSEGLVQNRHLGINFDIAVFTNLTPDHIEAHGSFENYKRAKGKLFTAIDKGQITKHKKDIAPMLEKTIVSNLDSEHGLYYLNFPAKKHISYGIQNTTANLVARDIETASLSSNYTLNTTHYTLPLPGKFNIYNTLAATAVAESLGLETEKVAKAVTKLKTIPGHMEFLQKEPFTVLIDYAHEKASMQALYEAVSDWPHRQIIQVFGATGGVRDKSRRTDLGKLAGEFANIVVITDEDPFDENPKEIIQDIATAALAANKKTEGADLFQIQDRKTAIAKALSLAQPKDLVLITGKGAEQRIARAGGFYEPWDDRHVVQELLNTKA